MALYQHLLSDQMLKKLKASLPITSKLEFNENFKNEIYILSSFVNVSIKYWLHFSNITNTDNIESNCIDDKFRNINDLKISIWDVEFDGFDFKKEIKNEESSTIDGGIESLVKLKQILPDIERKVHPKELDLAIFSECHGSLLYKLCRTGNLKLVKYFIEKYKLNPHFVYPANINVMFSVSSYVSRKNQKSSETLKYLAGLGCNMELIDTKELHNCCRFIANDDIANPPYINTKMLLSFGFGLDDSVKPYQNGDYTIRNRIRLGFRNNVDQEFGNIELLKPKESMNQKVLQNAKELIRIFLRKISGECISDPICVEIFECLNIRDICKVYQYTVDINGWTRKEECDFIQ